jgi:hypothetical protein
MFGIMKTFALLLSAAALTVASTMASAAAQVRPWAPYGTTGLDDQRYQIERQRQQAEASEALARQQALQTRLTIMELQARRLPPPTPDSSAPALRSVEQERAAREAATARRQTTTRGVSQIDSWLDRTPH